ncbi:MAG TPA: IS110 family transposase [Gemmatimonadales bacterium]|nr:IS110 family transposase [Gemmatimonadales bacterium]
MKTIKYVGLDVHKDTTVVAIAEGGREGEVRVYGTISSDLHALEKLLRKLGGEGVTLRVVYEAGPTGYVIYRRLQQLGIECLVVAPSRTPQPQGQRQKTDRRDAEQLARLHRAGELKGIHVPDAVDESIRDLTRTRADAVHDLTRAKQRLKSFLLRQGYRYSGKANWSEAHQRYLRELVLPLPALKAVLEEYLLAITQRQQQLARLDDLIQAQVPTWRMYPAVQALMCFRGIQLTAATVIVAELGAIHRFRHPRHLMAFLGLVPREHTTGDNRKLGSITKTGNAHARWCLGEVVQHAFLPPKVSAPLALRQQGQPLAYRELGWKMQTRLYQRGRYLLGRGVMKPKVTVALARELCGFVWALLRLVPSGDGPAPAPELAPPASRSATRRSTRASSAHTQMR